VTLVDYTELELREIASRSASWYARQPIPPRLIADLHRVRDDPTPAELSSLKAVANGLTTIEEAHARYVSKWTIHTHRGNLWRRLNARNAANGVALGFVRGYLTSRDIKVRG
jgi:DNA-binding NarL/FixJ family response regulator